MLTEKTHTNQNYEGRKERRGRRVETKSTSLDALIAPVPLNADQLNLDL